MVIDKNFAHMMNDVFPHTLDENSKLTRLQISVINAIINDCHNFDFQQNQKLIDLFNSGMKIEAVKQYRIVNKGSSLKEAVNFFKDAGVW